MDDIDITQLLSSSEPVDLWLLVIEMVLCAIMAFILERVYIQCAQTFSNRAKFARNFYLLSLTMVVIINAIKSSIALSLGLVGALSIVRFRTAVKEPEELMYLFIAIALGLGLGANLIAETAVSLGIIIVFILLRHLISAKRRARAVYYLDISSTDKDILERSQQVLSKYAAQWKTTRYDQTDNRIELTYLIGNIRDDELNPLLNLLQEALGVESDIHLIAQDSALEV